jgi:Yip1-like protein
LKVAVYSYTPAWIAGVFRLFPLMGILALFGALYGLYLLYLGLPRLMKCPQEKAVGYTAVVVIAAIVVSVVTAAIGGIFIGAGMLSTGALSSLTPTINKSSDVQFDKDSPLGRLQQLGEKLEESNKKAEAAEKSGDKNAQVAAAVEGFTTLLGGGRHIDPIDIDQLKTFVPETFAGLKRTSSSADKSGLGGVIGSKAEATYSDGSQKRVKLEVLDSGGASGLMAFAGWATLQGESDNADSSERTQKSGDRIVHEKASKRAGGTNEVAILLGNRFVVTASGEGVDVNGLKSALSSVDLAKLESMKDVGVSK